MRGRFFWVLTWAAFVLPGVFCGTQVLADFGDCTSRDYLVNFYSHPAPDFIDDFDCHEHFRFTVPTITGTREFRAISNTPGTARVSDVETGMRRAASAMLSLGEFDIHDVTVLIDPRSDAETAAFTQDWGFDNECRIVVYAGRTSISPLELRVDIAHEIFHCIQYASLDRTQMSREGLSQWWIEGSAEWFAAMAIINSQPETDYGAEFQAAVAGNEPLYGMSYEASVFFIWLAESVGVNAVMPFLRSMSGAASGGGQRQAMRAALSDEEWLRFAQDYIDEDISHPQGGVLALNPEPEQSDRIDEPSLLTYAFGSFELGYVEVEYTCGKWENQVSPADQNLSVRRVTQDNWERPWPEFTDAGEGETSTYKVAVMNTRDGVLDLQNDVMRKHTCMPCGGTQEVDACLMGAWRLTGRGAIEWLNARGMQGHATFTDVSELDITLFSDGTYLTGPVALAIRGLKTNRTCGVVQGAAKITAATGNWSAMEGVLNTCQSSGGMAGEVWDACSATVVRPPPGGGDLEMTYTCTETSLKTSQPIPGLPPIVSHFTRVSE